MIAWMTCEVREGRGSTKDKPCLFAEAVGMRRGDPPRCICHGALLFTDSTLNGMRRDQADKVVRDRLKMQHWTDEVVAELGQAPIRWAR